MPIQSTLITTHARPEAFPDRWRKSSIQTPFGVASVTVVPVFPAPPWDSFVATDDSSRPIIRHTPRAIMKVLAAIPDMGGGGAQRVMAGWIERMSGRGHEMHLLTLGDGHDDRHRLPDTVHRHDLNLRRHSTNPISGWWRQRHRVSAVRSRVRSIAPDVVLSFCDRMNLLMLAAVLPTGVSVVVAERSHPQHQRLPLYFRWQRRRLYPQAFAVTVQTDAAARSISRLTGVHPRTIESPVREILGRDHQAAWDAKKVIGVGRLSAEKGFDRLIDAFDRAADRMPQWTLHLYGDGPDEPSLRQHVHSLHRSDRIIFHPWHTCIDEVYRSASMFVLPSRYEGFPSALLEATSAGVPSVAVDCDFGPSEILKRGGGLLVDECGEAIVDRLSDQMAKLAGDDDLAERLSSEAINNRQRYGWSSFVDRYESLLQEAKKS